MAAGIRGSAYTSEVWMSTNGGVSWTQQTATAPFPARNFPDVQVDSMDALYLVAGLAPPAGSTDAVGLNDGLRHTRHATPLSLPPLLVSLADRLCCGVLDAWWWWCGWWCCCCCSVAEW